MPDPTAHADDMKSPAFIKPNEMPAFWWLNPWAYARNLKQALHAVDLLTETTEDAYQAAKVVIKQKEELAGYHQSERNAFLRKVELALKPACPHLYEDTIGYVHWAADEIKALRASLSVITEDRDAYIEKLQAERDVYCDTVHKLEKAEARVKQLTVFCENAGAERDYEKKRVEEITLLVNERDRWIDTRDKEIIRLTNLTRNLRRKLSKAEKAAGIKPAKKKGGAK
jgi:hypothetical protein